VDSEEARVVVTAEHGVLSAAEAARRAGSRGHSRTVAVRRWQQTGKVFAVAVAGLDHYPGFCFGPDGRPRPALAGVLAAFAGRLEGWELAGWFVTPNGQLGGLRPVDVLDDDPAAVAAAARAPVDGPD
jgi:hypothetical protein